MLNYDTLTESDKQYWRFQLGRREPRNEEERKLKAKFAVQALTWKPSGSAKKNLWINPKTRDRKVV